MSKRKKNKPMLHLVPDEQKLTDDSLAKILFELYGREATEAQLIAARKELTDSQADNHKKVKLLEYNGATSICIDAEITDASELLISGADGAAYEYRITLSASNKDRLLLALLQKNYFGKTKLISELQDFLKAKGIYSEFSSFTSYN